MKTYKFYDLKTNEEVAGFEFLTNCEDEAQNIHSCIETFCKHKHIPIECDVYVFPEQGKILCEFKNHRGQRSTYGLQFPIS